MTKPYAEVIGDPIAHSKSPLIHGFWLERLGVEAEYRTCQVRPEELADYLTGRREDATWRGCNVTIPHKQAAARLVDRLDEKARGVGAVNTVVRDGGLVGTNTDVDGAGEAISSADLKGGPTVVIGAGGAARAAFALLAARGGSRVRILARDRDKARRAAEECNLTATVLPFAPGSGAFAGAALLINATQLGMVGQAAMPGFVLSELAELADDALVFDMVYAPLRTGLLRAAAGRGLRTADGLTMLIGQAATAFERFFGAVPPRERDAELRALLTA